MLTKNWKNPLVTVYIANHNYGRFIEQAIESVYQQSFDDWELIIIDDGSTDNSREIIQRYQNRSKTYIAFQHNRGLNKTGNVAAKLARGKYIVRLDADDYMSSHALKIMVHEMEANQQLAMVFSDYYLIDESDNVIGQMRRHDFEKGVSLYDQPAHGACTLFRKSILQEIGGYDENFRCQDGYDVWLRMIHNYSIKNVDLPLFYYRQHGSSLSKNEEHILNTRARIKAKHVKTMNLSQPSVLAVIPIRGRSTDPRSFPLRKLGDKALVDWTIDCALQASTLVHTVVSTPDEELAQYISKRKDSRISVYKRDPSLALINTGIEDTLLDVMKEYSVQNNKPEALLMLSIETPFRTSVYMDKFVHTMQLFDVDAVHGVRPDDGLFFIHDGSGLKVWNADKKFSLERDILYRLTGGTILIKTDFLEKEKNIIGGRIGHVLFDQKASFFVRSELDMTIAEYLATSANVDQ